MNETFKNSEKNFSELLDCIALKIQDLSDHARIIEAKKCIHQAEKMLKLMELEVAMMPLASKGQYQSSVKTYRFQWQEYMKSVKDKENQYYDTRNQHVLMGSNLSETSSNYSFSLFKQNRTLETDAQAITSSDTMQNLKKQREKLVQSQESTRELQSTLVSSDKLHSSLKRRGITNKIVTFGVFFLLIMALIILLYINFAD